MGLLLVAFAVAVCSVVVLLQLPWCFWCCCDALCVGLRNPLPAESPKSICVRESLCRCARQRYCCRIKCESLISPYLKTYFKHKEALGSSCCAVSICCAALHHNATACVPFCFLASQPIVCREDPVMSLFVSPFLCLLLGLLITLQISFVPRRCRCGPSC